MVMNSKAFEKNGVVRPAQSPCDFCGERSTVVINGRALCRKHIYLDKKSSVSRTLPKLPIKE